MTANTVPQTDLPQEAKTPAHIINFTLRIDGTAYLTAEFVQDMLLIASDPEHPEHTPFLKNALLNNTSKDGFIDVDAFAVTLVKQVARTSTRHGLRDQFQAVQQGLKLAPVKLEVREPGDGWIPNEGTAPDLPLVDLKFANGTTHPNTPTFGWQWELYGGEMCITDYRPAKQE